MGKHKKGGKRQSLAYQMNAVLKVQAKAIGTSRYQAKKNDGHAIYDKIFSIESYKTHRSRLIRFGKYLKDEGVKNVSDIQRHHVEEYMRYMEKKGYERSEKGYTHNYLANTLTSINHLLHEQDGHEPYRCKNFGIDGHKGRTNNTDDLQRVTIPNKYQAQVALSKAAGLRRHEVELVNTKSFYECDERLYITIIGKGGRPRVTEVRRDYYAVMKEQYSDCIRHVDKKSDIPISKRDIQRAFHGSKELYSNKIPKKYSLHVYRSEYAVAMFNQIVEEKEYEPTGDEVTINGVTADLAAFNKLTESLGHGRIYVLTSYLGTK